MKNKEITAEAINELMEKMDCSYDEAKKALEKANERISEEKLETKDYVELIIQKIKEIVKTGNVTKILIKKEDKIVTNIPLNIGVLGVIFAFYPALIGIGAAIATGHSVEIIKGDGEVINFDDIKKYANTAANKAKDVGTVVSDKVKENITPENIEKIKEKTSVIAKDIKEKVEEKVKSKKNIENDLVIDEEIEKKEIVEEETVRE